MTGRATGRRPEGAWPSASACSSTTAPHCHGSDARGSKGFPNLTDGDWLYGGTPEKIIETITNGRHGKMPPMAAAVGTSDDVQNVANYVLSLSGSPHDIGARPARQEPSSPPARPATASTARATRRSARPT